MNAPDDKGFNAALATLVPRLALDLTEPGSDLHASIEGSMLSADISGFTALSERLASKGKAGAEEITSLINRCFSALIDQAYRFGGEVLKFGGDAVLVLFRGDDHERRAAAAGFAMQQALADSSTAANAGLTMTVGVGRGPFHVFVAGSRPQELLITGSAATRVIELEGIASTGQTLISDEIRRVVDEHGPAVATREAIEGHELLAAVDAPEPGPAERSVPLDRLEPLIPHDVREHFAAFAGMGGEHRIAAVGFVKVSGLQALIDSDGAESTGEYLDDVTEALQTICDRFDVACLHSDIAEDGVKFLLCAGAPVSHGNSDDAMLQAAVEIAAIATPLDVRVGVQRGRLFAGFLGTDYRHTYTLMGDVVNTAARMLTAAEPSDVVAVDDIVRATRTVFVTEPLEPFHVKGKEKPIHASRVVAPTESTRGGAVRTPLIGRETQLGALRSTLASGGRADLSGPAGAGKSRLLEAFRAEALVAGHHIVVGGCSPYSQATPYALARIVLRNALGIDTFADPESAGDILTKVIRHDAPFLEPMAPIIAIPLGAVVPQTPEAAAIDPKFLRAQINGRVADLLQAMMVTDTVVILEDTHWIDDPSAELFRELLDTTSSLGWTAVTTRRPEGEWLPGAATDVVLIEVAPLTDDDIRALAVESGTTDLTDRQLDLIVEQAEGNPLFAIELARAADESETVPDSVEQLIGARIDGLDAELRHAMRVAAVFGYRLKESDLATMLAPEPAPALHGLEEFLLRDSKDELRFTHALYRDVAYEGLPFAERKRMHRQIGEFLESEHDDPARIAPVLALHFAEASDSARTWTYGVLAGDAARHQAATLEAAANYERALDASRRLRDLDPQTVAEVALKLGDAHSLVGNLELAERAFRRLRSRAEDTPIALTAMLRIGRIRELQGRLSDALRWYNRALEAVPDRDRSADMLAVRSEAHFHLSGIFHRRNDQQRCIIEAREALGAAEDADDVHGMAEALQRLHLATVYLGRRDRIGYGQRALALFSELNLAERISAVHNNLGIEHYFAGRWTAAAESYRRASEEGVRAGSLVDGMLGALNGGEILSDQGHWDEALELLESARRNWAHGRYPLGEAIANAFLGTTFSRAGDRKAAEAHLQTALQQISALGLTTEELDVRLRLLEHHAALGQASQADLTDLAEQIDAATSLGERLARVRCLVADPDERAEAREHLRTFLDTSDGYERALTLRALSYGSDDVDPVADREAATILESLGVVRLQPLPPSDRDEGSDS